MKALKSKITAHPEHAIAALLIALAIAFGFCACAHNTGGVIIGTRGQVGLDPQNATFNASYMDGFGMFDVARENASWSIQIDSESGVGVDSSSGKVIGVKSINREIGPQVSGYLVDLAKVDSEAAQEYVKSMRAYWEYKKAKALSKTDSTFN